MVKIGSLTTEELKDICEEFDISGCVGGRRDPIIRVIRSHFAERGVSSFKITPRQKYKIEFTLPNGKIDRMTTLNDYKYAVVHTNGKGRYWAEYCIRQETVRRRIETVEEMHAEGAWDDINIVRVADVKGEPIRHKPRTITL